VLEGIYPQNTVRVDKGLKGESLKRKHSSWERTTNQLPKKHKINPSRNCQFPEEQAELPPRVGNKRTPWDGLRPIEGADRLTPPGEDFTRVIRDEKPELGHDRTIANDANCAPPK
jgi:hypothetical protein